MPSTVEIIAARLYDAGCRHAFGIPGGEVLKMMNALEDAGIAFTLAKHENGAGFMAEGTHHATGAPGILLATIGPGLANAVNVIANAEQDRVPLIVLTGCVDADEALTYTHQVMDHKVLMEPVTKASFTAVENACDVMMEKALAIATEGRPGPVHIDIPISLAGRDHANGRAQTRRAPAPAGPAEGPVLEKARAMFRASKRPIMVAGIDVLNEEGAAETLRDFVETHQVPLLTTYKGKGILPEDHELSLGGHGLSPVSDALVMPFVEQADLVIAAGYDPIEMRTGWRNPWDPAKVVEFAAAPNRHDMHHADISFTCSVGAGLNALAGGAANAAANGAEGPWSCGEADVLRIALKSRFSPGKAWGPALAIDVIRRTAPRDTVITADSGAHRILLSQMWECYEPRGMLQSTALCTMGCALPLAVGYKLARPERPIIAFMGDAGLEMIMGELATLRDLALNVLVVVFVDQSLALIELKQRKSGMKNLGVDFGGTDFPALAEAMGGAGRVAKTAAAVESEVAEAFARDGFTLLAIPIDAKAYDGKF